MISKHLLHQKITSWYHEQGRKTLPWQNTAPYNVWISEIMLQQTQVQTVIPYYEKFIQRFPNLQTLAEASLDEILQVWTGLGYYARARNLHKSAQMMIRDYGGRFPQTLESLEKLPGIGKSTAGAIFSLGFNQWGVILDGNVRRVLSRLFAISSIDDTELWTLATKYTPKTQTNLYNQAMMDLGALLCSRSRPDCFQCPLKDHCQAHLKDQIHLFPVTQKSHPLPKRETYLLLFYNDQQEFLLEQRPPKGIWGGLWSFPQIEDVKTLKSVCKKKFGLKVRNMRSLPAIPHTFTHFHLLMHPLLISVEPFCKQSPEPPNPSIIWHDPSDPFKKGLPQPIKTLLSSLLLVLSSSPPRRSLSSRRRGRG